MYVVCMLACSDWNVEDMSAIKSSNNAKFRDFIRERNRFGLKLRSADGDWDVGHEL